MDNSLLAVRVINHKYIVVEKSCTVSVFAIRNFKFLGFALGRNGKGIYVRVHPKPWNKFKSRLKELSSRKRCQSIKPSLEKIKVYARGWLNNKNLDTIANELEEKKEDILPIYTIIKEHPDKSKEQIYAILKKES